MRNETMHLNISIRRFAHDVSSRSNDFESNFVCGIQLSRRAFCSKRILRSPGFHDLRRTAETYAMFCLVVSTSKYGLLRAIFITVSGSIVVEHKFRLGLDDEL